MFFMLYLEYRIRKDPGEDLRLLCPGLLIWLGGPEVSFHCEELLEELPEADGILYGEGEESFPALLRHYIRKEPWPEGCVYREGGRIRRTPPAALTDLARLPFPYADLKGFENRILYYETSRGCPFRAATVSLLLIRGCGSAPWSW